MAFLIDQLNNSGLFAQSAYSAGIATCDSDGNIITATYLSSVDLTPYQTTADMINYQTVSGMSAYATTGELANKLDATAFNIPNSADWNSNYETVQNNSATWNTVTDKLDSTAYTPFDPTYISGAVDNKLDTTAFSDISGTFLTAHQSLADYATTAWVDSQGYLTAHQPISADEWNNVYNTVNVYSGSWTGESSPTANVDSHGSIDIVSSNNTVFFDVNGDWFSGAVNSALPTSAVQWNSNYETVKSNSASWAATADPGAYVNYFVPYSAVQVAIGTSNTASNYAFAEGTGNNAANYAMAQGYKNTASNYSISQGMSNKASFYSIAQGKHTTASHCSQAFGNGTNISNSGMAIGTFNKTTNNVSFVIGNGIDENNRSDSFIIYRDGSVSAIGKISANGIELGAGGSTYTGDAQGALDEVYSNSGNWNNTYTNYSNNSASYLTDASQFYPMNSNPSGYLTEETDWTNTIKEASANAFNEATALIPPAFDPTFMSGAIDNKLDTTAFSDVSGTFLTAHQSLEDYATTAWVDSQGYLTEIPASAEEALVTVNTNSGIWDSVTGKEDTISYGYSAGAISSINGSAIMGETIPYEIYGISAGDNVTIWEENNTLWISAEAGQGGDVEVNDLVHSNSAIWDDVTNKLDSTAFNIPTSSNWNDVYNTVNSNSGLWSAGDTEVNSTVQNNSATWDSVTNKLDTASFSDVSGSFLTAHQSLEGYATTAWVDSQGYLTSHQPISADEWNNTYETVQSNSASWGQGTTFTGVTTDSTLTGDGLNNPLGVAEVQTLSSNETISITSANDVVTLGVNETWFNNVNTTVQSNSGTWNGYGSDISYLSATIGDVESLLAQL